MGSVGNNTTTNYSQYAPAYDYSGEDYDDRNTINTEYFSDVENMPVNTNLNDWVDEARQENTNSEALTLSNYINDSSVNSKLRSNPDFINAETQALDRIINRHQLKKDTILYSGLSNTSALNVDVNSLKVGSTFSIGSYVSTSPDPVYAAGYTLLGDSQPTVLQINAPSGTHIAKAFYESAYGTEGILGRNSSFTVTQITKGKVDGETVRIIKVDLKRK